MLDLKSRQIYLDALRPPAGYSFDRAIGTTYSLDLATLLVVPFSFVMFECESASEALGDRIKTLQALRKCTQRIIVFCQKGQISIPRHQSPLYTLLEKMVVEVDPKTGGVFHPKVWAVRYTAPDAPAFYKLLVLTRNLTFDRSWDTVLVLEGEVQRRVYAKNNALRDFISFLPTIADSGSVEGRVLEDISLVSEELRHVDLAPPAPFDEVVAFEPIGMRRQRKHPIDEKFSKLLVVSPFVDTELSHLSSLSRHSILVSRMESLDALEPSVMAGFKESYLIDDTQVEPDPEDDSTDLAQPTQQSLTGLHAKLFVAETSRTADIWTGSANATNAAFKKNIEFVVRLRGSKPKVGINALLARSDGREMKTLGDLLVPYEPPVEPVVEDRLHKESERQLENAKRKLIHSDMRLTIAAVQNNLYDLAITAPSAAGNLFGDRIGAKCWPITLKSTQAKDMDDNDGSNRIAFGGISYMALTTFVAFELKLRDQADVAPERFVMNLPCDGMPGDRDVLLLSQIVSDQNKFLQFLLLLLSEVSPGAADTLAWLPLNGHKGFGWGIESEDGFPVMEELVRAFSRFPEKLEELAGAIEDLKKSPSGAKVFPEGWEDMWTPFTQLLAKRRSQ